MLSQVFAVPVVIFSIITVVFVESVEAALCDWQSRPADSEEILNALSFLLGLMQIRQKSMQCVPIFRKGRSSGSAERWGLCLEYSQTDI